MPRPHRETQSSFRELSTTALPFVVLALALLGIAYAALDPMPPRRVVLATGGAQGAYAAFGKRYQEELARHGIEVVLKPSAGSRENLRALLDPSDRVDLAFVQGGSSEVQRSDEELDYSGLMSLGSMFYEPVWLFYRAEAGKKVSKDGVVHEFSQLRGLRVNAGVRGSGIPGVVNRLLAANLMEHDDIRRSNLETTAGVVALLNSEIDVLALVSAPEAPMVQMLLQTPGIRLLEFSQADAYARRFRFLSAVTLPRGVVDLSRNAPPRDVSLLAATCSLLARDDLHPALVQLFVQAATRIHDSGGWMSTAGQFPSPKNTEFPLARDAERYYRVGPPLLQRYLPFWAANVVDRMWVALLSIAVVLVPLARLLPPLYTFQIRSRVFRWYRTLRRIDEDIARGDVPADKLMAELDKLDANTEKIAVPLSFADQLYALRGHIQMVRERLSLRSPPP